MVPLEFDDDDGGGGDDDYADDDHDNDGSNDDMSMVVARRSAMHKFCGFHLRRFQVLHNVSIWLCVLPSRLAS